MLWLSLSAHQVFHHKSSLCCSRVQICYSIKLRVPQVSPFPSDSWSDIEMMMHNQMIDRFEYYCLFFLFFYGSSSTCRIRRERLLIKQYNACGLAFCMYILFCFLVQDRSNNLWYDQMLHWISSWSSPVILRNVFFYIALGPVSGKL